VSTGFRRGASCLLAIMLALMPFASLHAVTGHPAMDSHGPHGMTGHAGTVNCDAHLDAPCMTDHDGSGHCKSPGHGGCAHPGDQPPSADGCCAEQCGASFGAQLCPAGELAFDFSASPAYAAYRSPALPDPPASSLLRPPSARS
jgi:hypothetical protein